tara:strand:+ start:414 stop:1061 length:648 start_codon:yes stop_codon:yes gene_type:complete
MSSKIDFKFIRPFGPVICKVTMPDEIINNLNDYVDKIIDDKKKVEELDHGKNLAGNVQQEFVLEKDFIEKSKWGNFLSACAKTWIKQTLNQEITKFKLISTWIVRQFQNDYNPIHTHGGHLSGVGYLRIPKNFGEYYQKTKVNNQNGKLALVHGSKMFMQESTYTVTPKVGDFYFFPNYLMHTVYPFSGTNDERRSVSFNAMIDDDIFNVFNQKK